MEPIMKMNKKLLMLGATFAIAAQFDSIATAASVTGTADAVVVAPLTITENLTMDFGTIAPHLTIADVIVMDTAGARNATGNNAQTIGGAGTPAQFTVTGDTAQSFALTYGDGTLTNVGGDSMAVTSFTDTSTGVLGGGTETFKVGATINVGINQAVGTYTTAPGDEYTVTVNYN
jgi:hypothetical protein